MFRDSAYRKFTPYRFFEESTRIPNIFPAYIGNGMLVLSLDASGLQGLNHGVPSFSMMPSMGDMYMVRHGMVADTVTPMNHAPLGWFSYTLTLGGETLHEGNLDQHVSNWSRCIFLDEARVETTMVIDDRLSLTFGVWIPCGKNIIIIEVTTKAYDHSNQPVANTIPGELCLHFNFTNRRTGELVAQLTNDNGLISAVIEGHETYRWSITAGDAGSFDGRTLKLRHSFSADNTAQTACFTFCLDGASVEDLELERMDNHAKWLQYYNSSAAIDGRSDFETFMYNNSLYLCRACFTPKLGLPIGFPFNFPYYWHASTFWDSTFAMDGLMASGNHGAAAEFLDFLLKAMRSEGKPYAWMCLYDGTPSIKSEQDFAPLVLAAHATTAIRYYQLYRERLDTHVFPIVGRVCETILPMFGKVDGVWKLTTSVSNDVVEEEATEQNHTYTALWFVSVLSKYAQYAAILGKAIDSRVEQIVRNYKPDIRNGEYLHCQDVSAADCVGASWLPFLLYPTEAAPFVDMDVFAHTRAKYCFNELYMEKQGSFQPWTSMNQAMSDWRLGRNDLAQRDMEEAYNAVFGPGLFSEIGPHQQTGGLPPYITAHGVYMAAYFYPYIHSSVHADALDLFTGLTPVQAQSAYRVQQAQILQNAKTDAVYTSGRLDVRFHGNLENVMVTVLIPPLLLPTEARFVVDKRRIMPAITRDRLTGLYYARFTLPRGTQNFCIE